MSGNFFDDLRGFLDEVFAVVEENEKSPIADRTDYASRRIFTEGRQT
nr:hypothetical protein [Rhizobium sp. CNPSo 4039]